MKPKIKSPRLLKNICASLKKRGKKVVFTNGCFDILHAGHIRYLQKARNLGDILVVALNSDSSVKQIKGKQRPIVPLKERAEVIASLSCVDYVTHFNHDNPYQLISSLVPDILVKGGDWKIKDIIGSDVVLANGGQVKSLRYYSGKSTTHLIQKIVENYS